MKVDVIYSHNKIQAPRPLIIEIWDNKGELANFYIKPNPDYFGSTTAQGFYDTNKIKFQEAASLERNNKLESIGI